MSKLTIVPLGLAWGQLTLEALEALVQADKVLLRTGRLAATQTLSDRGIAFTALDHLHDSSEDFDALCTAVTQAVLDALKTHASVAFGVIDPLCDETVNALIDALPKEVALSVLPGVSLGSRGASAALGALRAPMGQGLRVVPAVAAPSLQQDPSLPLIITEVDTRTLAGEVKLWLLERYPGEHLVALTAAETQTLPLAEIDRQPAYDHRTSLYVPPAGLMARQRFGAADLVAIMGILRGPQGCPWDLEQTHESLRQFLIEEAYEAVDAVDSGDPMALADELGDVLLQVVFHAEIARQHGSFTFDEVTTAICAKMISRHAHIFGDTRCATAQDVLVNWDKIKQVERGQSTQAQVMRAVPKYLPALMRAAKVQKKAANVGFDWADASGALPKVYEEAQELAQALATGQGLEEESGDLLFAAVNVLRLAGVTPELALARATEKFLARFEAMENHIIGAGKAIQDLTLAEMDVYWDLVKCQQAGEDNCR